jgi:hypothetical protein
MGKLKASRNAMRFMTGDDVMEPSNLQINTNIVQCRKETLHRMDQLNLPEIFTLFKCSM